MLNKIKRKASKVLKLRPGSEPFISGDSFRKCANHIYEEGMDVNIDKIKNKDVVFVSAGLLDEFFKNIHPAIQVSYTLISHNGDTNITEKYLQYIDGKIIKWFAQNVDCEHDKIIPIPIGLENKSYYISGIPSKFQSSLDNKPKLNKILVLFGIHTNPKERQKVFDGLKSNSCATVIDKHITFDEYFNLLKKHKFVASPKGNGIDCHRTWEALYMNCIPITTKSVGIKSFNLPIDIIDNWDDFDLDSEEKIEKRYDLLMNNKKSNFKMYFQYWKNIIKVKG